MITQNLINSLLAHLLSTHILKMTEVIKFPSSFCEFMNHQKALVLRISVTLLPFTDVFDEYGGTRQYKKQLWNLPDGINNK
jgi:hypothetical protein